MQPRTPLHSTVLGNPVDIYDAYTHIAHNNAAKNDYND